MAALPMEDDELGRSVDLEGNVAVVASEWEDHFLGSAHVFYRGKDGEWQEVVELAASDATQPQYFGSDVALDDDILVVGSSSAAFGPSDPPEGSVYLFQRDHGGPDQWGEIQKLTASDGHGANGFGHSVAIWNDIVVVGAPADTEQGDEAGAIYLFERIPGHGTPTWTEVGKLTASDAEASDRLGSYVAFDQGTIVAGAPGKDIAGAISAGAVYVFNQLPSPEGAWTEINILTVEQPVSADGFGSRVAIDGNLIAIRSSRIASGQPYPSIVLFERKLDDPDNWVWLTRVQSHDVDWGEGPSSPALSGDWLLAGSSGDTHSGLYRAGSAYLFRRDQGGTNQWGEVAKLIASDANKNDFFGRDLAIDGTNLLIGARGDDEAGADTGAAYIVTIDHIVLLDSFESGGTGSWTIVHPTP